MKLYQIKKQEISKCVQCEGNKKTNSYEKNSIHLFAIASHRFSETIIETKSKVKLLAKKVSSVQFSLCRSLPPFVLASRD